MPPLEARRTERVDYNAEVELLAHASASGAPHRVFAHAFDLGAGGMRVAGPLDMAVGEEVTCRVTLDGRPASLPGRIAWRREASAHDAISAHWMGICFQPLGTYESGLLQHVVERSSAGYRPVELHFTGFDEPVVARARTRTNGLRLSAALPIFARNTELTFQLDAEGPLFTGRIGDIALREENGARRLEIEVDVIDDAVRFRRRARYGYADEIEAEDIEPPHARHASLADTQPNATLGHTVQVRRPSAPRGPWLSMILATVAGGVLAWYAATQLHGAPLREAETEAATEAEFVARPRTPDDPLTRALAAVPVPTPQPDPAARPAAEPALAADRTTRAAVDEPAPEPLPATPSAQAEISPARPAATNAPSDDPAAAHASSRSTASTASPAPTADPALVAATVAPTVLGSEHPRTLPKSEVDGDLTRIRIPFTGSLEKMRSVVWAEPAALAVDLPGASTSLEYGRYVVAGAGVTELRVNKNEVALLLRVRLSAPVARYAMTAENGTLELLIQRVQQRVR